MFAEKSKNKTSAILAISIPTVAVVLAFGVGVAWFCSWRWRSRRLAAKTLRPSKSSHPFCQIYVLTGTNEPALEVGL